MTLQWPSKLTVVSCVAIIVRSYRTRQFLSRDSSCRSEKCWMCKGIPIERKSTRYAKWEIPTSRMRISHMRPPPYPDFMTGIPNEHEDFTVLVGHVFLRIRFSSISITSSMLHIHSSTVSSSPIGATAQRGPGPSHSWGIKITHNDIPTVGRTPLDGWSAHRRDFYPTTHIHIRDKTSRQRAEFESATPASDRPYAFDLG